MENKKLVLFGAGKIGRSFIGQLFSGAGYEVVFVDISSSLTDALNRTREYKVVIKSDGGDMVVRVGNVRAVHLNDTAKVLQELSGASVAALSVGQQGLPSVIPLIAQALVLRRQLFGDWPLDIIIAENMRNADEFMRSELTKLLPEDYPFGMLAGLVETSIGKMVPLMTQKDYSEDPLQVFAEPYNTLIVSAKGFKNPVPAIEQLAPKENIKAWVDCKLFIHNLGHAAAAYLGYQAFPGRVYIYEVLESNDVYSNTLATMQQSAVILEKLYPGEFKPGFLEGHIRDLLNRFRNKALGDTVFRVGCDLYRKLGPDDRLAGPVHAALKLGLPYHHIADCIEAAIQFRAKDENGNYFPDDQLFFAEAGKGTRHILQKVCKLNPDIVLKRSF